MSEEAPHRKTRVKGPRKIGRYYVQSRIGSGGMGVVYKAEDRSIGRQVAVKMLNELTPELLDRFYLEARAGIVSHPNIATVYELGQHQGCPFIAMEFIDGESLEQILARKKTLPLLEAIAAVEQLCTGLGYAHGHGIVHRDIKPANVLVRPDGRVSIVDFGVARLLDQTQALTKADTLLGTFRYIAPERLKGEGGDGRADIWSAGVILYELLTGHPPFDGNAPSAVYRILHEPYRPAREIVADLPEGVSRILERALDKDVQTRYATAEEMAFDLRSLVEGSENDRTGELLETAEKLVEQRDLAKARAVLLEAHRHRPADQNAKALLSEVQEQISLTQRNGEAQPREEVAKPAVKQRRKKAVMPAEQTSGPELQSEGLVSEKPKRSRRPRAEQGKSAMKPASPVETSSMVAPAEPEQTPFSASDLTRVLAASEYQGEEHPARAELAINLHTEELTFAPNRTEISAADHRLEHQPVVPSTPEGDPAGIDRSETQAGSMRLTLLDKFNRPILSRYMRKPEFDWSIVSRYVRKPESALPPAPSSVPARTPERRRQLPIAAAVVLAATMLAANILHARLGSVTTQTGLPAPSGSVHGVGAQRPTYRQPYPAPDKTDRVNTRGTLLISANPWATVLDVTDEHGNAVAIPKDRTTPLRIDVVRTGEYRVRLADAGGEQRTMECAAKESGQLCTADFGLRPMAKLLRGSRR